MLRTSTTVVGVLVFSFAASALAQIAASNPSAAAYAPRKLPPSLRTQGDAAATQRDYPKALDLYRKWLDADPGDETTWYNLACLLALTGNSEQAVDAFETSVDAGFRNGAFAAGDTDLETLRGNPRFAAALKRIETNAAAAGPVGYIRRVTPMRSFGTYIVMLPPDYETSGREYPVCLILHGNGSTELSHGLIADRVGRSGIIYIAPRAPHPRFDAVPGEPAWTAGMPDVLPGNDPAHLQNRLNYVQWIFDVVRDAQGYYRIRKGKVFIYGHSQGARFAVSCALVYPDQVASVFSEAGPMQWAELLSKDNLAKVKQNGISIHLLHGEQDNVVPPDDSRRLSKALEDEGVSQTLQIIPGDHRVTDAMITQIRKWVDTEVRSN